MTLSVRNFKYQTSNGDFNSLISICSFITMHNAKFCEAGRMSSTLLVFVIFAFDLLIRIYHRKIEDRFMDLKLSVTGRAQVRKFLKEKSTFLGQTLSRLFLSSSLQNYSFSVSPFFTSSSLFERKLGKFY